MKIKYLSVVIFLFLCWSSFAQKKASQSLDFPLGERIKFKIYFGWFALGEAEMSIADTLISQNNKPHYHSFIQARTIGLFSWFAGIDNTYWGYVGTKDYRTTISEKHLQDRKGKYDQWNTFNWQDMYTRVKIMDYSKPKPKKELTVKLNDKSYDLHGTYLYLRSKLWLGYDVGDSIMLNTYWEDKLYDFGMEYGGVDRIKYNGEKVTTHKFYGLFPITSTFPKEKAVTVWILEKDGMGIPLLIEADMKIGKVRLELKEYTINGQEKKI